MKIMEYGTLRRRAKQGGGALHVTGIRNHVILKVPLPALQLSQLSRGTFQLLKILASWECTDRIKEGKGLQMRILASSYTPMAIIIQDEGDTWIPERYSCPVQINPEHEDKRKDFPKRNRVAWLLKMPWLGHNLNWEKDKTKPSGILYKAYLGLHHYLLSTTVFSRAPPSSTPAPPSLLPRFLANAVWSNPKSFNNSLPVLASFTFQAVTWGLQQRM
ncbi:uncharacterized protein LOC105750644 [Sarcophilus harrisii]|uniref:uncharacterized protein LOC105750644 n=1 Tax=Sarcophilus harrisii TaxID=9305 RepID=UPI0013020316|nr:uncharacterized protein LOC105750644 [Sarcophilus harrisii]